MPLYPPQPYRKTRETHRIGLAADRPAATDVLPGTLYFSTDTKTLERSDGTTWDAFDAGNLLNVAYLDADNVFTGDNTFNGADDTFNSQVIVDNDFAVTGSAVIVDSTITTLAVNGLLTLLGGQIKFPAVQVPSSDVNTLDDYEEGTWTPTLVSSGGGTPTYTTNSGTYQKVGNRVTGTFTIVLSGLGTLAAGNLTVDGLTHTAATGVNGIPCLAIFAGLGTNQIYVYSVVNPSTTSLLIRCLNAAGTTNVASLTVADITAAFVIAGGFVYNT